MSLSQEQAPISVEAELREFLTRRFVDVGNELQQPSKFPERKEMPYKPQTGDVHYFGDPATHNYSASITSEGFWGLTSGGWIKLSATTADISLAGLGVWRYRTETGTPPASGQIRFDNTDVSSATEFYLSETNNAGTDVSAFLELLLKDGSLLYIQDQANAANRMLIEISSSVDSGTYRTYGIESIIEEGTEPTQNQTVILVSGGVAPGNTYMYPIWAEENAALGDATYEWAFGNGADTPSNAGITVYVPPGWTAAIVAMTATNSATGGTSVIEADINGSLQGANCNVTISGRSGENDSFTPVALSSGDRLTFRTTTAGTNSSPSTVTAWIRMTEI